jgi:hypothetical protein|tara:strand:+ start:2618 stop:2833 length:216 start_codon:yes stop_codon:yes gene_type:complete
MIGKKKRLDKAKKNKEYIKLIFNYPNSKKAQVRRGIVIGTEEDSFEFNEDRDGKVVYEYKYITEIKNEIDK